jgi:hypothetical protein
MKNNVTRTVVIDIFEKKFGVNFDMSVSRKMSGDFEIVKECPLIHPQTVNMWINELIEIFLKEKITVKVVGFIPCRCFFTSVTFRNTFSSHFRHDIYVSLHLLHSLRLSFVTFRYNFYEMLRLLHSVAPFTSTFHRTRPVAFGPHYGPVNM